MNEERKSTNRIQRTFTVRRWACVVGYAVSCGVIWSFIVINAVNLCDALHRHGLFPEIPSAFVAVVIVLGNIILPFIATIAAIHGRLPGMAEPTESSIIRGFPIIVKPGGKG